MNGVGIDIIHLY